MNVRKSLNIRYRWIGVAIVGLCLAACGRAAIGAAPRVIIPVFTLAPTLTAEPMATITPTTPSLPTATLAPTAAPTLTPTATPLPPTAISRVATPRVPGEVTLTPSAIDPPIGQHAYSLTLSLVSASGITQSFSMGYLLYLPRTYGQDPAQRWPLVLFLHGSGEVGSDPERVAANGLPQLLTGDTNFPFIVLSPQAPEGEVWWGTELDRVGALLDALQPNLAVDPRRVYLTGLSMGGFGAWAMVVRFPQRFAAVVPIAGGWNSENDSIPSNICGIKDVPIWVFHGAQDDIVSPRKSQLMVDALQACGGNVRFTLYPDADHRESFKRAYADPELYEWLLAQHLP